MRKLSTRGHPFDLIRSSLIQDFKKCIAYRLENWYLNLASGRANVSPKDALPCVINFQVMMNYLWFNRTLSQAVVDPRLHHQLMPMYIRIDKDFQMPLAIQEGLQRLGHNVRNISGYAVVQAAATNDDGTLTGKSDPRKSGWAAGYWDFAVTWLYILVWVKTKQVTISFQAHFVVFV